MENKNKQVRAVAITPEAWMVLNSAKGHLMSQDGGKYTLSDAIIFLGKVWKSQNQN